MAWTALSFAYQQVATSSDFNALQANFTALAQGLTGAPNILAPAITNNGVLPIAISNNIQSVKLSNDYNFNNSSYVARTGASVSITIAKTSVLLFIESAWSTSVKARINANSGTYYYMGYSLANTFLGGALLITGLTPGVNTFVYECAGLAGSTTNNIATSPEIYMLNMVAMEV
jgi:hypothetical protein